MSVKERINLRDEMDAIITQKYKKDQEMPQKKRKDKTGMQKIFGIKKREQIQSTIKLMNQKDMLISS